MPARGGGYWQNGWKEVGDTGSIYGMNKSLGWKVQHREYNQWYCHSVVWNIFQLPLYGQYNSDRKPDEDIIIEKNYYANIPQEHRCKMIANQIQHCIKRIISHAWDGFILRIYKSVNVLTILIRWRKNSYAHFNEPRKMFNKIQHHPMTKTQKN